MSAPKRDWETKEPLSPADALRLTREPFEEADRAQGGRGHGVTAALNEGLLRSAIAPLPLLFQRLLELART
jgi:hypothetical protein